MTSTSAGVAPLVATLVVMGLVLCIVALVRGGRL